MVVRWSWIRRRWRLVLSIVAVGLLGIGVVGWLCVQRVPGWYRPARISPYELQAVKDDLLSAFERLSAEMNGGEPFEFRLSAERLNRWLAAREAIWPPAAEWVPPGVDRPYVGFDTEGITVAGTYGRGEFRCVISGRLAVSLDDQGIRVRLLRVAGGALPVPWAWVRRFVDLPAGKDEVGGDFAGSDRKKPSPIDVLDGAALPTEWTWPNGRRRFRVTGIALDPGQLVLRFEPL